jgi:hypothetical protein
VEYESVVPKSQVEVSASPKGLTISEAAKLCPPGISEAQIRQAAARGRLRSIKIDPPRPRQGRGRPAKILIDRVDLTAFISEKTASKQEVAS